MKTKQDKKIWDKEIEKQMDREFEKYRINTHVFYFRDVPPFNAVTVVTSMPYRWEEIASIISEYPLTSLLFHPAAYLLQKLAIVHDLHGIAICDKRDTFNRQEGRCRAKRRLLRHLKKREGMNCKK